MGKPRVLPGETGNCSGVVWNAAVRQEGLGAPHNPSPTPLHPQPAQPPALGLRRRIKHFLCTNEGNPSGLGAPACHRDPTRAGAEEPPHCTQTFIVGKERARTGGAAPRGECGPQEPPRGLWGARPRRDQSLVPAQAWLRCCRGELSPRGQRGSGDSGRRDTSQAGAARRKPNPGVAQPQSPQAGGSVSRAAPEPPRV